MGNCWFENQLGAVMDWLFEELMIGTRNGQEFLRLLLRLGAAAMLGGLLGLERQRSHKSTGIRTHVLVALGAALFTLIADQASTRDGLSRVIQGVAAGVGFLGGGTILKEQHEVRGLTTAASVWMTAAIGVAVGSGWIVPSVVAVFLAWLVLSKLPHPLHQIGKEETEDNAEPGRNEE